MQTVQSYSPVSVNAPHLQNALNQSQNGQAPPIVAELTADEIDWAIKIDKRRELGYVPGAEVQERYNKVIQQLQGIHTNGGYIYEDTTAVSSNPKGFAAIGSLVGRTLSGGYVGYQYAKPFAREITTTVEAIKQGGGIGNIGNTAKQIAFGIRDVGLVTAKAGGISAAINGGVSVVSNLVEMTTGNLSTADAVGNVAADTVGGLLSGMAGAGFAGMSVLGMTAAKVGGLPTTIMAVTAGVVGSLVMDKIYKGSGLFTILKTKVSGFLD